MTEAMAPVRFLACGDAAVTVEFGSDIDPGINARVLALDAALAAEKPAGLIETVPTYRSLMVQVDPLTFDYDAFEQRVRALVAGLEAKPAAGRRWKVPVVYGGKFGIDLEATAERHGLTPAQLIDKHAAPVYRVYMIGFMPGFTYLGGLDPTIATLAPGGSAADDAGGLCLHRRHPGAHCRPGHAVGLAHPRPDAGAHVHGRARAGLPHRARRRGGVRADRGDALGCAGARRRRGRAGGRAGARMTELVVEAAGPATSLQDAGRFGWQRFGVGPAGAMDRLSLALANVLAGNAPATAAIEFALAGGRLRATGGPVRVALAGAECGLKIDGKPVPPLTSATAHEGQAIEIGAARSGVFAYLAVAGGFTIGATLGSLSLHHRTGVGGLEGRTLRAGDRLPLGLTEPAGPEIALPEPPSKAEGPIRVVLGPQDDNFTAAGIATFLGSAYTISEQADRMGIRLTGDRIEHSAKGFNIVSDGIPTGGIQVPGNQQPLILLADRQTTGGYPKIATVISWDLPRLVQCRPGTALRFAAVERAEAVRIARSADAAFRALIAKARPAGLAGLDSGTLLGVNLVDGVVDARA